MSGLQRLDDFVARLHAAYVARSVSTGEAPPEARDDLPWRPAPTPDLVIGEAAGRRLRDAIEDAVARRPTDGVSFGVKAAHDLRGEYALLGCLADLLRSGDPWGRACRGIGTIAHVLRPKGDLIEVDVFPFAAVAEATAFVEDRRADGTLPNREA